MIWLIFKCDDFYCIPIALNNNSSDSNCVYAHTVCLNVTFWLIPYENVWNFNGMQNDTFLWHIRFISSKQMHSFPQRQMVKIDAAIFHSHFCRVWNANALRNKENVNINNKQTSTAICTMQISTIVTIWYE